jgi:hypothetical protein
VPRLSIVIPCLGGAAEFDAALVAVLQHRPANCEVLVIHRDEYEDPYDLAGDVQFLHAPEAQSLCDLLNEGLAEAEGEFLHVLGCGLAPEDGWTEMALGHFRDPEVAAVTPAVMQGNRLAAAGVRFSLGGMRCVLTDERLLLPGSGHLRTAIGGPTLAAGFYRREILLALGGFDAEATDRLADVSLAIDLAALDLRCEFEPAARICQVADSWAGAAEPAFARGRAAERLFWRHSATAGSPLAMMAHAFAAAVDLGSIAGRLVALCEWGSVQRHEARIAAAREQLRAHAAQRRVARQPMRRAA